MNHIENHDYAPRASSIAGKVTSFFMRNRDEVLDVAAIAVKFECSRLSVHTLLAPAVAAGWLRRYEDRTVGDLVYASGLELPRQPIDNARAEVVVRTEQLAKTLLQWRWKQEPESQSIALRNSENTRERESWEMACTIQRFLTSVDVESVVASSTRQLRHHGV